LVGYHKIKENKEKNDGIISGNTNLGARHGILEIRVYPRAFTSCMALSPCVGPHFKNASF
jgi:hypothetical protein